MSPIRELNLDKRDLVLEMMNEFAKGMDEVYRPKPEIINRLLDLWSTGKIVILGKFDDEEQIVGIVILGLSSNRLILVHIHNTDGRFDKSQIRTLERELFDAGFECLKQYESWVTSGWPGWFNENLIEYALDVGFERFDVINMKVDRESIETVTMPTDLSEYTLKPYESQWREMIADLFYDCFKDSPDARADPHELSTPERSLIVVNDITIDRYGDFKNGLYSWTLWFGDELIGVNFQILPSETTALVAGLSVKHSYRGKGLGRLLFLHSLKDLLKNEQSVNEIHLETTSLNPAKHLYSSVGFNTTSTHSRYTWNKT